jgi:hypothetical protein
MAGARAASTFDATECRLDADFDQPTPPAPTDPGPADPSPGDEPTPPPPGPVATSVDCGFGDVPVTFYPGLLRFRFADLPAALVDQRPRLTG